MDASHRRYSLSSIQIYLETVDLRVEGDLTKVGILTLYFSIFFITSPTSSASLSQKDADWSGHVLTDQEVFKTDLLG